MGGQVFLAWHPHGAHGPWRLLPQPPLSYVAPPLDGKSPGAKLPNPLSKQHPKPAMKSVMQSRGTSL